MRRTTIVLDEETKAAARDIARRLDCSTSEAIRRAIRGYRIRQAEVPAEERQRRVRVLRRLIRLFAGHDPRAEVRRLKSEDAGF